VPSPTVQTPSPTVQTPSPTVQTPSPTVQTPSPTAQTPSPTVQTPSPTVQTPSPTVQTPSPTVQTPSPTVQTPSPTVQTPSPTVQTPSPTVQTPSPTTSSSSTLFVYELQNLTHLYYNTFVQLDGSADIVSGRGLGCSGGVCSGVTSEAQGYALLLSAMLDSDISIPQSFRIGWKSMCNSGETYIVDGCIQDAANPSNKFAQVCSNTKSTLGVGVAQGTGYCCNCLSMGKNEGYISPWKYQSKTISGYGSATDGDEDAILGLIYLAERESSDASRIHALQSILAFLYEDIGYGTVRDTRIVNGNTYYVVRTGSSFGGFTDGCYNPSYFSPASYQVFADYLRLYGAQLLPSLGDSSWWNTRASVFESVIDTGYEILSNIQCSSGGAIPNWVTLSVSTSNLPWENIAYSCSYGTPSQEFGSDASRAPWRICLHYTWYNDARAKQHCSIFTQSLLSQYNTQGTIEHITDGILPCSPGVTSILDITNNGYMFGPISTSLVIPLQTNQITLLKSILNYSYNRFNPQTQSYFSLAQLTLSFAVSTGAFYHPLATSHVSSIPSGFGILQKSFLRG
jgi:hypothetical protein